MDGFSTCPISRHLIVFLLGKKKNFSCFFYIFIYVYKPGGFSFNSITLPLSKQTLGRLPKTVRHRVNGKVTLASASRQRLGAADWNWDKAPPKRGRQTRERKTELEEEGESEKEG